MTRGAAKLKGWRLECGLTQVAAAERADVSQGTWHGWESGRKRPAIEQIVKLAEITAASKNAITLHDFVESEADTEERRALRRRSA